MTGSGTAAGSPSMSSSKAIAGHFGYFQLVLDMVDGKIHPTAEDEMTFEPDCVLVVADDGQYAQRANRAVA